MDHGWRMHFTFHGQPHALPKVRPDKVGELEPRALYKAAFGGAHPASVEQSLRKSFLCQAYVRLLDLAGDSIFLHGKRVTRKQCIDRFKLHPQWDELGLASTTTQRERDGGRAVSQADKLTVARPIQSQSSYLPRDDPAGFPALSQTQTSSDSEGAQDSSSPLQGKSIAAIGEDRIPASNDASHAHDLLATRLPAQSPGNLCSSCLKSTKEPSVGDGRGAISPSRKTLKDTIGILTDVASPLPLNRSLPTSSRPFESLYHRPAGLDSRMLPAGGSSPSTVIDELCSRRGSDSKKNGASDLRSVHQQPRGRAWDWHSSHGLNDSVGSNPGDDPLLFSDGLGYASYRYRRSASWSTADAMLTAAMLGPTSDMASTPSPTKDQLLVDLPSDIEGFVGVRALYLSTLLQGQSQELHELKRALSRGPAGMSESIRAVLRLEEYHNLVLEEVQLLRGLTKDFG